MFLNFQTQFGFGNAVFGETRRVLPRVLFAIAMDGHRKLGSLEEQICLLAQAFRAEHSLLLPVFLESEDDCAEVPSVFRTARLKTAQLNLFEFSWKKLGRLLQLVDEHQIELIHWHFYPPVNRYLLALTVLRPRLRHFFTDHNSRTLPLSRPPGGMTRIVKTMLLKRYSKVLGVSHFVMECLSRDCTWSNVESCRHFINTDRFLPDSGVRNSMRRKLDVTDRFVALVVAHLIPEKGVDVAIRALSETPSNVVMWIVGTGSEETKLRSLATASGLDGRIAFFGQQALVQPYMQAADCLVCPSTWAEAAGLVNLEALSTGLPVVASRIGGIPEYVDDGVTGMLFRPGDHQELAALLGHLQNSSDLRRQMGDAARAAAIDRFSVASNIDQHLGYYRTRE